MLQLKMEIMRKMKKFYVLGICKMKPLL